MTRFGRGGRAHWPKERNQNDCDQALHYFHKCTSFESCDSPTRGRGASL
jgi:hypothetical protein